VIQTGMGPAHQLDSLDGKGPSARQRTSLRPRILA